MPRLPRPRIAPTEDWEQLQLRECLRRRPEDKVMLEHQVAALEAERSQQRRIN